MHFEIGMVDGFRICNKLILVTEAMLNIFWNLGRLMHPIAQRQSTSGFPDKTYHVDPMAATLSISRNAMNSMSENTAAI